MTHCDLEQPSKTTDAELFDELLHQHSVDIILEPHIFRLDSHQAMGAEMKLLRQTISTIKKRIVEVATLRMSSSLKPNTHRRRRRDAAVELSRVGGVYGIRN